MILLQGTMLSQFGRAYPREISDVAWRSLVGLAATVDPALAPLNARERLDAADVGAVVGAVSAAIPALPRRTADQWIRGMMRVLEAGRRPAPRDYWSTMEPQLGDLLRWLGDEGRDGIVVEHRGVAQPSVAREEPASHG